MAYQNVGTPRFWVNILEWLAATGYSSIDDRYRTLPVGNYHMTVSSSMNVPNHSGIFNDKSFVAILGHNLPGYNYSVRYDNTGFGLNGVGFVNADPQPANSGMGWLSTYNGFSIITLDGTAIEQPWIAVSFSTSCYAGSIIFGTYYDIPHSPDLKLTMKREMDGVKRVRTKGGSDLIHNKYTKSPLWGNAAPWELYSGTPLAQELARIGRRVWDLSFSYLSDSDVFPLISNMNFYESGIAYADSFGNTLLDSNTFYSQVIHKTNGGQLPFIFQPDKDNNNPDGFAIAKFDMISFKFDQVANGVYNVKLKIREVW